MKLYNDQLHEIIRQNEYTIPESLQYVSRDFSGDYINTSNLPPLSLPGGDIGQLAIIYAASNNYGFELDKEKVLKVLIEVIGGENNFSYYTTGKKEKALADVDGIYINYLRESYKAFSLTASDIEVLEKQLATYIFPCQNFRQDINRDVAAGAVLIVRGEKGVLPRFQFQTNDGMLTGTIYIFHRTLVDKRNKLLAQKLLEADAVTLFEGCDEHYLYDAITETLDMHFFETVNAKLSALPLYTVTFKSDDAFHLEQE